MNLKDLIEPAPAPWRGWVLVLGMLLVLAGPLLPGCNVCPPLHSPGDYVVPPTVPLPTIQGWVLAKYYVEWEQPEGSCEATVAYGLIIRNGSVLELAESYQLEIWDIRVEPEEWQAVHVGDEFTNYGREGLPQ